MTLTRRTALAAPALLALPSAALARQAAPQPREDALARLATFCNVFSKPLAAFPEPMAPDDRAALLAMTADDLEELRDPLLPLAAKYGMSLDWLFCGDVRGLLVHARHGLAKPPHELKPDATLSRQAEPDPAVAAFERFRIARRTEWEVGKIWENTHFPTPPQLETDMQAAWAEERAALNALTCAPATTPRGRALQLLGITYAVGINFVGSESVDSPLPVDPLDWRAEHFHSSGDSFEESGVRGLLALMGSAERGAAHGA